MTSAQVVIGANYGDEGKGRTVDRLAAEAGGDALVIRYNASAQAGHTVVAPDGRRHVFHHVGAGAFAGAATLLSRYFMLHPMLLGGELDRLAALGVRPRLHADMRAPVAVPHDVLINQIAEEARGDGRHGSCGIGFNEAVERSLRPRFALCLNDLRDRRALRTRVRAIRDHWVPRRLAMLGLAPPENALGELLRGDEVIRRWLFDVERLLEAVDPVRPGHRPAGAVIFEGAQGLLLDQDAPGYPHLTRSRTGLANVVRLAQEGDIDHLSVVYVTRAYLTRHGAGPLQGALAGTPGGIVDPTNLPNDFQGAMRFAWLDLDALGARLRADLGFRASGITATAGLALTCLDQRTHFPAFVAGRLRPHDGDDLIGALGARTGLPVLWRGDGPGRDALQSTGMRPREGTAIAAASPTGSASSGRGRTRGPAPLARCA